MLQRFLTVCVVLLFSSLMLCGVASVSVAQEDTSEWVGKLVSLEGDVAVSRSGRTEWHKALPADTLFAGDRVQVGKNSRAAVVLQNDALVRIDQNSTLVFGGKEKKETFLIELLKGAAHFFSRKARSLKIITPFVNGVVEGTEFLVRVDQTKSTVSLFEGSIHTSNPRGTLLLKKGEVCVASADQAPRIVHVLRPGDSVHWALYYPPILGFKAHPVRAEVDDTVAGDMRTARDHLRRRDLTSALAVLESVDVDSDAAGPYFYTARAGLRLSVGRVEEARKDIRAALALDSSYSRALALLAVIEVVQNRKDQALELAGRAVAADHRNAAAHIALSYAHQALFDLPAALADSRHAVDAEPENAIAWARLAEMHLSRGDHQQALFAARKAVSLAPAFAQPQTVLGFAYVVYMDTGKAAAAFRKAIALDSAAPMPRLGLGLALIREGDLASGRKEIEIAAGLDPASALLRSYLAKAYFEEKRDPKDGHQLAIAKQLDPQDPTPWLYDAIRKQSLNRPVEALHDLQTSMALNDNRAVYRSRLMLDEDLATRGAGIGRIYNELGFDQSAMREGARSLGADATNPSAHRLLADSYANRPNYEIARASEMLQAQLFQPLNLMPVPAHSGQIRALSVDRAETDSLSLNEYTSLFASNGWSLNGSAFAGSQKTRGDELILSGVQGRYAVSLGQYHYESDGFRENNGLQDNVYHAFLQARLSPATDIQWEYSHQSRRNGDMDVTFNGDFSPFFRDAEDIELFRLGLHHKFSASHEMIASAIHTKFHVDQEDRIEINPVMHLEHETITNRKSAMLQLRSDYRNSFFHMTTGGGYQENDNTTKRLRQLHMPPPIPSPAPTTSLYDVLVTKYSLYSYLDLTLAETFVLTVGASGDFFNYGEQLERHQFNPKLGLRWNVSPNTLLRIAAFRTLSTSQFAQQTIEPTHVAGFNQLFEDRHGTDVRQYGIGLDHVFSRDLSIGFEGSYRELDVPFYNFDGEEANSDDWQEQAGLAYLYWTISDRVACGIEYHVEHSDRRENPQGSGVVDLTTQKMPVHLSFFHPFGTFLKLKATNVVQSGDFQDDMQNDYSGSDNFWIADAEVGYRLPNRLGTLTFSVYNLGNTTVHFHEMDPFNPTLYPERSCSLRLSMHF